MKTAKDAFNQLLIDYSDLISNGWFASLAPGLFAPLPPGWFAAGSGSGAGGNSGTTSKTLPATIVGSGNFKVNLVWDSTVTSSTFQASINKAALAVANALSDTLTVNLGITNSGTGGGASAGPSGGLYESYSWVYSHLKSGDPTFSSLSNSTSIQGQTNVAVWNAQLKLWGVASTSSLDGSAQFATDIGSSALFGVALHELTHALGRVPYGSSPDVFDFFRYTAPGKMLFSSSIPAPLAYFSIDGGVTNLAYYGMNSDPSDFYNGTPTGQMHSVYNTTYDAFSEYYYSNGASNQYLSALDLHSLVAIGFHLNPLAVVKATATLTTTPVVVSDSGINIQNNLDYLNSHIDSIYSISQNDTSVLSITAAQSVSDSSILMLLNLYEKLNVNVTGSSGSDNIYGIGNAKINGGGGVDNISLLCHTSTTVDTICDTSAVSISNLEKVTGFLSTDKVQLANSATSLNGLTNLGTGSSLAAGAAVATAVQVVKAGAAFTVSQSGIDVLDITGASFSSVSSLITSLSSNAAGSTYATFGAAVAKGSHFLVEYTGSDGTHIAEITQGATSNHLASSSTGVDLIDLIGVSQHVASSNLLILAA
ncbi:MAG: hypothetical protein U1E28_21170 [Beijerinckiaceae bacterium]